ncbi:hypothetical protein ACLOJK_010836 [Asimina triloba]
MGDEPSLTRWSFEEIGNRKSEMSGSHDCDSSSSNLSAVAAANAISTSSCLFVFSLESSVTSVFLSSSDWNCVTRDPQESVTTCFSVWDFKLFYDMKFGRKRETEQQDQPAHQSDHHISVANGHSSNAVINGNGNIKGTSDMAIFEQFQSQFQERNGTTQLSTSVSGRSEDRPDIIRGSPDVTWESVKGLENAKRLLKEAVVMPIKYPK